MNIVCSGIDYSTASIEIREKFSLTKAKQVEFYEFLRKIPQIRGAVIISTCNRMELCLSLEKELEIEPFELINSFLNSKTQDITHKFYKNEEAIRHLCMVACGAKSQIFGEDQIITQVKSAITFSRENDMADAIVEVLFRTAVTCAKKIKTSVNLTTRHTSISDFVLEKMKEQDIKSVLVIGNGEMGRHIAKKLLKNQFEVTMSVRQYKHSKVSVPEGCKTIDYDDIYEQMSKVCAVISATLSPHYTIKYEKFSKMDNYPKFLYDLAVPRDIDSTILNLGDVFIYDVDTLSSSNSSLNREVKLAEIAIICDKYIADFCKWYDFKKNLCIFGDEDET